MRYKNMPFKDWAESQHNEFKKAKNESSHLHCVLAEDFTMIYHDKTEKVGFSHKHKFDDYNEFVAVAVAWARYKGEEVPKSHTTVQIHTIKTGEYFTYNNKKYRADSWSGIDSDFRYCVNEDGNIVKFNLMEQVIVNY